MKLDKLQYQLDAIEKVIKAINAGHLTHGNDNFYANPVLRKIRNIDVKMETGTGKTYVYTRLIHELKRQFGFFKFIILVPGIPIKEGVRMSIQSDVWNKHFRQEFNNQSIHLSAINAGDFSTKKGKRKQIPESLRSFCDASSAEEKSIQVLLLNDDMLASSSMTRNDYDSTLFGSISCPVEGLKQTRPIIIIDEPHRFKKSGAAWKNITEKLCPQLIIRFGATFPDKIIGTGKNKQIEKDYENLVYDLNSVRAFNEGLVKGVHIVYPEIGNTNSSENNIVKCKIKSIEKGKKAAFSIEGKREESVIRVGENLSVLDADFGNVTLEYDSNAATKLCLSTGLIIEKDQIILPRIFAAGYQELLLQQAIDAHFEKEKENFYRKNAGENAPRIKTNSLFFIDSISSFRGNDDEEKGWLRKRFEELLAEKLKQEIKKAKNEYKEFLQFSLQHISETIAGYFSQDNRIGDGDIQKEVDDILRNKEQMLRFKNEDGTWNIRRFLFSKWTLREGWDNPNVFVITKLRSSGSENSKIQEVGRGLRLPFDENGTRINDEEFYLTYIIDYSEHNFAQKLVGEINTDGGVLKTGKITENILEQLVKNNYAQNIDKAKGKLLLDDIIDAKDIIIDTEKLFAVLPENSGLKINGGKIIGDDLPKKPTVKLNKDNFRKLNDLWNKVTKRYFLHFNDVQQDKLCDVLTRIFSNENIFATPSVEIVEEFLTKEENNVGIETGGYRSTESSLIEMSYGNFLKRLHERTVLPLPLLHQCLVTARKDKKTPKEFFNIITLENIVQSFEKEFINIFAQGFSYFPLDYASKTSLFTDDGDFVEELPQGLVGEKTATDIVVLNKAKYLYDKYVYDSEIEHDVLKLNPPETILVYGKLPKRSIKLPTYTGGTTSPDFVYAIKKKNSEEIELHLIVETKGDNPRLSDEIAVNSQKKAFETIGTNIRWRMTKDVTELERELKELTKNERLF
jgi:type III restriction enzyme